MEKESQTSSANEAVSSVPNPDSEVSETEIRVSPKDFSEYCNTRFSTCIEYPKNFIPQGESNNGDGQSFLSDNEDTVITIYGSLVSDETNTIDINYEYYQSNKSNTYQKRGDNYFIVSGIINKRIYYKKMIEKQINYFGKENTRILISHEIRYPESKNDIFGPYCEKINRDLR